MTADPKPGDELEASFEQIFERAPLGLTLTTLEAGTFVRVNEAFLSLSGYTREALLGRSPRALGLWADPGTYERLRERLRRDGMIKDFEAWLQPKVGAVRNVLLGAAVVAFGGERCVLTTAVDLTWRTEAERRLREREARYRSLFNSTDEGFCVVEVLFEGGAPTDYRFLEVNPRFEQQTGLHGAVGRTARELVPELEAHWFEVYGEIARTGRARRFENGSQAMGRWFDVYAFRLGENGAHVGILFKDVTERRQAEAALAALTRELEVKVMKRTRQVQELAGQLTLAEARERARLAGVLHDDLQQRLYAVQFALRGLLPHAKTAEAQAKVEELKGLVADAVAVSRTMTTHLSPPVLRHEGLLEALVWLGRDMAARYGLEVELDAPSRVTVPNEGVRVLLFYLVRELLFNVVKHAGVDRVSVSLRETAGGAGDQLELSVRDLGRGFDPAFLDGGAGGAADGTTGLGLLGVRQRLELFGGHMALSSAPEAGTCVSISLPRSALTLG